MRIINKILLTILLILSICMPCQAKLIYLADYRDDSIVADFSKGSNVNGQNQFSGIIESIAIFDGTLTDDEHLFYYNNDVSVLKLQGVELQGLAA